MQTRGWIARLSKELTGWHVWHSSPGPRWNATPAPAEASHTEVLYLPNRVSAATPQGLRTLCRERYGWDDHCETCGVLARECGHRTPETKVTTRNDDPPRCPHDGTLLTPVDDQQYICPKCDDEWHADHFREEAPC